jgi:beta-glucosidase-like glycosyl hydrolase
VQQEAVDNGSPFLTIEPTEIQVLVEDMSFEEKIGQLLILETSLGPSINEDSIYNYAKSNQIGGVILTGLDVIQYMRIVDNCNAFGENAFLHGTRENVNVCNQFGNTPKFPSLASIHACQNDSLVQNAYEVFEKQLEAFNFDFAIGPNISTSNKNKLFDAGKKCLLTIQ